MTPRPWTYGIGNEADSIFDANGAKACQVFHNLDDRFIIVRAVNLFDKLMRAQDKNQILAYVAKAMEIQ